MTIIPPIIESFINAQQNLLLAWFSDEVYKRLLARDSDHFLVQLCEHMDWEPLEKVCAGYHHEVGPGARPTHTVKRLVRALAVKYLKNLSLREMEHELRWNLLTKWFVGYAVFDVGPDHTTLERFEQWVREHHHRIFFDEVLRQIDETFPQERHQPQMGDTFAMRANATPEGLIKRLRHASRCLLRSLQHVDSPGYDQVLAHLDQKRLFGKVDETPERRLDGKERQARLQDTVVEVVHCMGQVTDCLERKQRLEPVEQEMVTIWLERLAKILLDEVKISHDEAKAISAVTELPKEKKGSYRIGSATDPDATYRYHGDDKIDFGFNISVAATDEFIREIRADTGSKPDAAAIPDLLDAQQTHHELAPPKFIYDAAAGTGKYHAQVEDVSQGQTQLVAPLVPYEQRSQRFSPDDFTLSVDGQSLICPHGQTSTTVYRHGEAQGRTFRFSAQQCMDCPLFLACRGDEVPAQHMRQVYISDHRSVLARARTYAQTDAFWLDIKRRPIIERIIANLVRYHGARFARCRGLLKADFQAKMSGMAFNLRQWMRKLVRQSGHRPRSTITA